MKLFKLVMSFLIALSIILIPLPSVLQWLMPQFCLLTLFAWSYSQPHFINVGTAWLVGLLIDVLTGSLLGLHAFSLVLVLYLFLLFHARICMFHRVQQSLIVGGFAFLNSLIIYCLQSMFGEEFASAKIMFSAITTALLWSLVLSIVSYLIKPHKKIGWEG